MRTCESCGEEIRGRSDKRFCSDQCRTTYHNQRMAPARRLMKSVEKVLRRNHRILEQLYTRYQERPLPRQLLLEEGFSFHRVTQVVPLQEGVLLCVYDYGYRELEKDQIRLFHRISSTSSYDR